MRPINFTNIKESSEGDFPRLEPGAYACAITEVEDFPTKEYLRVLVDIVQGERANYFSDDFYRDKPFAHSIIMSYKDSALGMLKGRLHVITDCNPGFDAEAAFGAGKEQMLVGKAVGVVFREEEYWNKNDREFKLGSPKCFKLCKLEDVTSGKYAEVKPKMLDDAGKRDALSRAGYGQTDIDMILMAPAQPAAQQQAPAGTYDGPLPF